MQPNITTRVRINRNPDIEAETEAAVLRTWERQAERDRARAAKKSNFPGPSAGKTVI